MADVLPPDQPNQKKLGWVIGTAMKSSQPSADRSATSAPSSCQPFFFAGMNLMVYS